MRNLKKQYSVWVVDDDVSIGWVLDKALTKKGYIVTVFRSVKPLLMALKNDRPDVVISDIQMPGVDGLKLLQLMHENFPTIPVIIMTAYSDLETTIKSYKKGAFEYLGKPFDLNHVAALVEQACRDTAKRVNRTVVPKPKLSTERNYRHTPIPAWKREFKRKVSLMLAEDIPDISHQLYQQIDAMLIEAALEHSRGHKQNAAKALGWGRNTLTRKIQDLCL